MRGKFITLEGIDGSGKSTQLRLLADDLRFRGYNVLTTQQPGGTPLGRRLREAFLETDENVAPMAELLLFAADRAQHVEFLIKPALQEGKIVLSDRYADATVAYQGAGRGFSPTTIKQVVKLATDGLKPDLTLFFDLPVGLALQRTNKRDEMGELKNRLDKENSEFYERVRRAYLEIIDKDPKRFRIIDATLSVQEIHAQALEVLTDFLKK
ncbi:MAG TPA: dTMP kinase [Pyrinomonadaceae bacterium]|nr:dTMP kinase [Pyrinomonadaceae bacterium]